MTTDERLRLLYARLERENSLLLTLLQEGLTRREAVRRLERARGSHFVARQGHARQDDSEG